MSGLASDNSSTTVSSLVEHGDFGVGTFKDMDGEMIMLNSVAYQMKADGSTPKVEPETKVPFAMVTRFQAEKTETLRLESKAKLQDHMERLLPTAKNAFVLMRAKGAFKRMKIRAIHAQDYKNQKLSELTEHQMVKEFEDVRGTIIGLESPAWSSGVSVVGLHAHFIDDGHSFGGHILELESDGQVDVELATSSNFNLQLPTSDEFGARELETDEAGIKKAEG